MKKTIILSSILILLILLAIGGFVAKQYYHVTRSNFISNDGKSHSYFLTPDMNVDDVVNAIQKDYQIKSDLAWNIACKHYNFDQIKPGYYEFPAQFSSLEIINRLQNGKETPINISFNHSLRTREQLAAHLGEKLLIDSTEIKSKLDDATYLAKFNLTPETAVCLFIPNTYEVYWGMSVDQLFKRMHTEYKQFWNEERLNKAKKIGLSPTEVATLASIIACETNNTSEHPTIASLYMNRIRKGMPLQACPTVIFAVGDFSMRRVLNKHLEIDSPYNTYKYKGLPPGPIRLARPDIMEAVLDAPKTEYLFMCANPDFSGTHIFSTTYAKHKSVAKQYQRELDRRKIKS